MSRLPALHTAYILYIGAVTLYLALARLHNPNGWTPGDWLINYEGGFVRRGLPGQAILVSAHALHLSPVVIATLLPVAFYAILYLCVWLLYQRSSGHLWTIAALLSPATLAFPILDSVGGFRKETIDLAALAFLLVLLIGRPVRGVALALYLSVVSALAILSHEALAPYLLYFLGALLIAIHDLRRLLKIILLPCLTCAIALYTVVHHKGDTVLEQNVCRSLGAVPPIVCNGAISYLSNDSTIARQDVAHNVHAYHYLLYFPLVTLLALLPIAAGIIVLFRHRHLRRDLYILLTVALLAAAGSTPLFLYAMDWGRWIYIHIVSLFLLLAFLDARAQAQSSPVSTYHRFSGFPESRTSLPRRWIIASAVLLFATCWNIPHYGNFPKKGYFNVPLHLLKQKLG